MSFVPALASAGRRAASDLLAPLQRGHREAGRVELLPVVLRRLAGARPDDRLAGVVDAIGDPVALFERDARQHAGEGGGDMVEGVVVVFATDPPPVAAEARAGAGPARLLDRRRRHGRDYAR